MRELIDLDRVRPLLEERGFENAAMRALFYGAPGTGKTLAVQAIASELDRDVRWVNMAGLVSKYVGETSQNIVQLKSASCYFLVSRLYANQSNHTRTDSRLLEKSFHARLSYRQPWLYWHRYDPDVDPGRTQRRGL